MISGSIVALVTPMRADGAVDFAALAALVEWHIQSGTNAIVAKTLPAAPEALGDRLLKVASVFGPPFEELRRVLHGLALLGCLPIARIPRIVQ